MAEQLICNQQVGGGCSEEARGKRRDSSVAFFPLRKQENRPLASPEPLLPSALASLPGFVSIPPGSRRTVPMLPPCFLSENKGVETWSVEASGDKFYSLESDGVMLYRPMGKTGDLVSILGYGCMRFPRKDRKIDEARTERQVISAIEKGVNYFDTAYMYPGSEAVLGKILAKGYRDKVMIATKIPPFMVHSRKDMDSILTTSLKRLQTDYIDYYLMHNLSTFSGWEGLKQLGIEEFINAAVRSGKIKHIGFSFHGDKGQFKRIVDDYPWDFCLIQYNYMDEYTQAGKEGLEYAASKGLGIAVMEPLRGGLLANKVPPQVQAIWSRNGEGRTPAEWALRWIWNHPQVSVVLSGMNEESQVEENIRVAETALPESLSAYELERINEAKEMLASLVKINCTGCGYCMPCPAGVNIPLCFRYYNDRYLFHSRQFRLHYMGMTIGADGGGPSYASLCMNCEKCEKHCPQDLPIRRHLKEVVKEMERFYFKPVASLMRGYYKVRRRMKRG